MICVEYTVEYPANVVQSTVTFPEPVARLAGDLVGGLSICFTECRFDWYRIARQSLCVIDATQSVLRIGPHPGTGLFRFAGCRIRPRAGDAGDAGGRNDRGGPAGGPRLFPRGKRLQRAGVAATMRTIARRRARAERTSDKETA